ncbi:hypothetical protein HNR40_006981 [Nonomuraea endophytica]|uniref:Uncharacterized protein n=1 Tax=Nonomuraea endophytica TaxID=714136 RepID=A0A7W8AA90_9ACTN|nr:hypothetical protein [Nonomuraea endophytica]
MKLNVAAGNAGSCRWAFGQFRQEVDGPRVGVGGEARLDRSLEFGDEFSAGLDSGPEHDEGDEHLAT